MNGETIVKTVLSCYPDVEVVYLFGSYLTPDQQQDSDADIAVLFPHEKAKLGSTLGGKRLKIIFQLKPGNIVRIITGWPI